MSERNQVENEAKKTQYDGDVEHACLVGLPLLNEALFVCTQDWRKMLRAHHHLFSSFDVLLDWLRCVHVGKVLFSL